MSRLCWRPRETFLQFQGFARLHTKKNAYNKDQATDLWGPRLLGGNTPPLLCNVGVSGGDVRCSCYTSLSCRSKSQQLGGCIHHAVRASKTLITGGTPQRAPFRITIRRSRGRQIEQHEFFGTHQIPAVRRKGSLSDYDPSFQGASN